MKCFTVLFILGDIFGLLQDGLQSVRNKNFIGAFKDKFLEVELMSKRCSLKEMYNLENPLFYLMQIEQKQKGQNSLTKELITIATSLTEIDRCEIMKDAFYQPSRNTFTYAVLFNELLKSLPIHEEVVQALNGQLDKWEQGVFAEDLRTWEKFTAEEARVVRTIWTPVAQKLEKKYDIDSLFDATYRDMKAKLEIKEKVVTCLDSYCEQAHDKNKYYAQIQIWHHHFEQAVIQSVKTPSILMELVPFAEKLNPYANVVNWKIFLHQQTATEGKILNILMIHSSSEKQSNQKIPL